MTRTLDEYASEWQANAEADALWVILTDSRYYGGRWDVAEFFATGEEEIRPVFGYMRERFLSVPSGTILDFGCGVGRVARALKRRFDHGIGVDISPRMIELARNHVPGVTFMVNQSETLEGIPDGTIDFVYSHIVLQHIPNRYQTRYIDELLRVLRPGGMAVLQIPIELIRPMDDARPLGRRFRQWVKRVLPFLVTLKRQLIKPNGSHHEFKYEMHVLPQGETLRICHNRACLIEAAPATNSCEPDHDGNITFHDPADYRETLLGSGKPNQYLSCMYFVRKPSK
jgi:ubiquinone/menaquinone biosynthesis C-methylase UbiE